MGGVGWGIGGVGYYKNIVYVYIYMHIYIYTHVSTEITVGTKLEILRFHLRFNHFKQFQR